MEKINPKDKRKITNRNDIIDGAEKLFFNKGYENSTMDEIAKESGFTKRTLYSYFTSKEEIYQQIMLRGYDIINNLFRDVLEKNKDMSELVKIRDMGYTLLKFEREYTGYYKAIFEYEGGLIEGNAFEETTISMLKDTINEGIRKNEITDKIDPITLSLILWSSIMGFVDTLSRKEGYINSYFKRDINEVTARGMDLILNSIKKKKGD